MSGNRGRTRGRGARPSNFETNIAPARNEPPSLPQGSKPPPRGQSSGEDLFPTLQPLAAALPAPVWGKPAASALPPAAAVNPVNQPATTPKPALTEVSTPMPTPKPAQAAAVTPVPKSESSELLSDSQSETSAIG